MCGPPPQPAEATDPTRRGASNRRELTSPGCPDVLGGGQGNLGVGEQLHRRLAMQAAEEHLSLNQYVIRRLNNAS